MKKALLLAGFAASLCGSVFAEMPCGCGMDPCGCGMKEKDMSEERGCMAMSDCDSNDMHKKGPCDDENGTHPGLE